MNPSSSWAPLVGSVLGSAAVLVAVYLGHLFTRDREARGKRLDAALRRKQRSEDFEERSLIEFLASSNLLMQSTVKMAVEIDNLVASKDLKQTDLSAVHVNIADFMQCQSVAYNALNLIFDDETRGLANDFYRATSKVRNETVFLIEQHLAGSSVESTLSQAVLETSKALRSVSDKVGEKVRAGMAIDLDPFRSSN